MAHSPYLPEVRVWIGLSGPTVDDVIWHIGDEERGKIGTAQIGSADIWSDVTPYVRNWSFRRGASRGDGVILRYEAGTATIELNDGDRRFDPTNLDGPYTAAGETLLRPMVRVKITAEWAGVAYRLWTGYADAWTPDYNSPTWSTVTLTATDAFKIFAAIDRRPLLAAVGAGENSGLRVVRILNSINWPAGDRVIAAGDSTLQGTLLEGPVLTELQNVADSELGEVWMAADGRLKFRNRNRMLEDVRSAVPQATFGDASAGGQTVIEDFEGGVGSWFAVGGSVSLSTSTVHGGTRSLLTTTSGTPTIVYTRTTATSVVSGHRYQLKFWIYSTEGGGFTAAIDWQDSVGGYMSTSYSYMDVPAGAWTLLSCTAVAPGGASAAGWGPTLYTAPEIIPAGSTFWIDDMSFADLESEIPYKEASVQNDDAAMANKVSVSIAGGTEQLAEDATSQARYLVKVFQKSDLLLQTDADALQYAKYVLFQSKDPELRFADVTLGVPRPQVADQAWPSILGRELGDRVTVIRRPPGGGDANYRDNFVRGIEMSSDGSNFTTKFQLQSATKFQFWTIGDPTLGRVGMNAISW